MSHKIKQSLIAAVIFFSVAAARADVFTFHVTSETSATLESLGTKFVIGCVVLALGIIGAAVILRKK
jgi:hypothetical protein